MKQHTFGYGNGESEVIWDVKDIWKVAENLPIEEIDVSFLFKLVRDKISDFDKDDFERSDEADTSYPIIVDSKVKMVIDGVHRIHKLFKQGGKVPIKRIKKMPPPIEVYGKPFKIDGLEFTWPKKSMGTECFSNQPKSINW